MLQLVDDISPKLLPSLADFVPHKGNLDEQCAWKNFGGLTLEEAYAKFCQMPEVYQEDFMFMGARAFHYYFPVVDEYLRSRTACDERDDCEADILGSCVAAQFDWEGAQLSDALRDRIKELCGFVLRNLSRFAWSVEDQGRIKKSWLEVEHRLHSEKRRGLK